MRRGFLTLGGLVGSVGILVAGIFVARMYDRT